MTEDTKDKDLMITALQQRIGELVSSYESQMAYLRVEYTKVQGKADELSTIANDLLQRLSEYEKPEKQNQLPSVEDILKEDDSV